MTRAWLLCACVAFVAGAAQAASSGPTRDNRTQGHAPAAKAPQGSSRPLHTSKVTPINPTYNLATPRSGAARPTAVAPTPPATRYQFTEVAPRSLW